MTKEERSRLEALDTALQYNVREHIRFVVTRVRDQLARRKDELMSSEPFALEVLTARLPARIRSAVGICFARGRGRTGTEKASKQSSTHDVVAKAAVICKPVSRGIGNRMFWSAILTRRWNSDGFRCRPMSGTGR